MWRFRCSSRRSSLNSLILEDRYANVYVSNPITNFTKSRDWIKKAVSVFNSNPEDQIRISHYDVQFGNFVKFHSHEQLHFEKSFAIGIFSWFWLLQSSALESWGNWVAISCGKLSILVFPEPLFHFPGTFKECWRQFNVIDETFGVSLYFDSLMTRGKWLFSF